MTARATRWGIASAGNVCTDYVTALRLLPRDEHEVVAVAARDQSRADAFAKKFDIKIAYNSYEKLAQDGNVDVVYIGSMHNAHCSMTKLFLNAGKAVLCEKPLTRNLKEAKEVIELARTKNLFLAEGFWSRHFPAWKQLKKEIEEGKLGTPKMVTADLGKNVTTVPISGTIGSVFLPLGCYPIMAANSVFNDKPEKVVASGLFNEEGQDTAMFITLHYTEGRIAQLNIRGDIPLTNTLTVSGTKASAQLPSFWTPNQLVLEDKTYDFPLPKHTNQFIYKRSEGFVYQAQAVRESLLKGEKESPAIPLKDSETIMEIMDEVRRQLGIKYDVD